MIMSKDRSRRLILKTFKNISQIMLQISQNWKKSKNKYKNKKKKQEPNFNQLKNSY